MRPIEFEDDLRNPAGISRSGGHAIGAARAATVQHHNRSLAWALSSTFQIRADRRPDLASGDAGFCTLAYAGHLFEDRASGSRDNCTGLAKALAFLKPGDCLVVWKLDRLGRSLSHRLSTVNELKERGVAFRSLTPDPVSSRSPSGQWNETGQAAKAEPGQSGSEEDGSGDGRPVTSPALLAGSRSRNASK